MKHILYFFDARKGSRIDLFWARSDIYVVNFDLSVFIEGVNFQKVHSNIKVVVWYGDSRFQRFLMISSHLHRNFQFWSFFYLVTKTSTQLLTLDSGGSGGETYIKWKAWASSFRKNWSERESSWEWWWNDAFKKWPNDKVLRDGTTCLKDIHFDFLFMFLHKKVSVMQKHFTYRLRVKFFWFKSMILFNLWLETACFFGLKRTMM